METPALPAKLPTLPAFPDGVRLQSASFIQPVDLKDVSKLPSSLAKPLMPERPASMSFRGTIPGLGGGPIVPPAPIVPAAAPAPTSAAAARRSSRRTSGLLALATPASIFPSKKGYGVAIAPNAGLLFTTSFNSHCVEVFQLADPLAPPRTIGKFGAGDCQFKDVCKCCVVAVGSAEHLLVVDADNERIQELTLDGTFVRAIGKGVIARPHGVACDGSLLAITETNWKTHRVSVLDFATGALRAQFGSKGGGTDQFESPCGITIDSDARLLYIADSGNVRVCVYTVDGAFVKTLGTSHRLKWPMDVCLLGGTELAVADTRNHRVVVLNTADDSIVRSFGHEGESPGEFKAPAALALTPESGICVLDSLSDRMQVFS